MINVPVNFIYELKKALNLKLFCNPATISDFIDIFHDELFKQIGNPDLIKSFAFIDGEYEIKVGLVGESSTYDTPVRNTIAESTLRFCSLYRTAITLALQDLSGKDIANSFDLVMESRDCNILSLLIYTNGFESNGLFYLSFRLF